MEIFLPIVLDDELHQKFKFLLEPTYNVERKLLEEWWSVFVIKDGEEKTIKEFQTTFHSMFWELYLNKVFLDFGYSLDNKAPSPDFIINYKGGTVCIEAVVANISIDGRKETDRTTDDVFSNNDHYSIVNESIVRLFNSIDSKSKKYFKNYKNNEMVSENSFVLALSDYGQVNYGQCYIYSMLAVLYSCFYDPDESEDLLIFGNDSFNREYKFKENHTKDNGSSLKLGLFLDQSYKHISAIIFSCTLSLGKLTSLTINHDLERFIILDRDLPSTDQSEETIQIIRYSGGSPDEVLNDGLFVFHNPFADKPLDENFLKGQAVTHIKFDEDSEEIINIECDESNSPFTNAPFTNAPLKRRTVGYKGQEYLVDNFDDFIFYQVAKA